jgi:hypothetical protein
MIFFFQWLRDKGVQRILKVIVDDLQEPAHSDEAIEEALKGFSVEILDWRKLDICPETICKASDELREVYLRWTGNNATLRAWSEPEGLKKLQQLRKVHLAVKQVRLPSESPGFLTSNAYTDFLLKCLGLRDKSSYRIQRRTIPRTS